MNAKETVPEPGDLEKVQPGYLGAMPAPGQLPARGERMYVDRPEQLLHAASVLKQSHVIAIDAEFVQVRSRTPGDQTTSSHRLALLQLAVDEHCFVVDAWRLLDLSPLRSVVEDPAFSVLLHGAGADMRVMSERDLHVAHYYDLEAASRSIFGQHESSLAAMLQRAFNVRLDKSLQRTDWTRRPLPPAMVAYAARDAEMTLALYYWLDQHYRPVLKLHEYTDEPELGATWIEPFLRGTSPVSPEVAVAEAKEQGLLTEEQIYADCRAALALLKHPMYRSRLLRLIADLALVQMVPEIEPLLQAPTSDERAAATRALGRMGVEQSAITIQPLLQDPVYDVRKAAQHALQNLNNTTPRAPATAPVRLNDGTRSWSVGSEPNDTGDDSNWKARLRSMMEP
ncbi:MAG: HEAT repeat domain-containing protein [Chloroflexota bacterium]|nr:HEAT repeat domain-containing protein [Chloroflexota bacterium]